MESYALQERREEEDEVELAAIRERELEREVLGYWLQRRTLKQIKEKTGLGLTSIQRVLRKQTVRWAEQTPHNVVNREQAIETLDEVIRYSWEIILQPSAKDRDKANVLKRVIEAVELQSRLRGLLFDKVEHKANEDQLKQILAALQQPGTVRILPPVIEGEAREIVSQ